MPTSYWDVPELESPVPCCAPRSPTERPKRPTGEEVADDDEDRADVYSAAYDEMVYRDSTADNIEGSMMESVKPATGIRVTKRNRARSARLPARFPA